MNLTKSQREIAGLLVDGKSRQQIADFLMISIHTVDAQIQAIYKKLKINGVAKLVHYAFRNDWIEVKAPSNS